MMSMRNVSFARYLLLPLLLLTLAISVSGCGDKEPEQRKAFIDYLQTGVLAKQKLAVPQLTDEQKKTFDPYASDYAILTDFHHQMDSEISQSMGALFSGMRHVNSVQAILNKRDELQKLAESSAEWQQKLVELRKVADDKHAALKQPDDLKEVYDRVYDKVITQPAALGEQIFVIMPKLLNLVVAQADLIKSQGDKVKIIGNSVQFTEQAGLDKYGEIQQQLIPLAAELQNLGAQMQQMAK